MGSIYICFSLRSLKSLYTPEAFEKDYQSVYKPLAKFLHSHPDFCFSFTFSGPQLLYFKKKHNEFLTILKQLIDRRQVEILGNGFYDPVFPLLLSVDTCGQIEMLTTELRRILGKRPRGICVYADCWDLSLVSSFQKEGLEYVLLDHTCVPDSKKKYLPIIMSEHGKAIEIYPTYTDFLEGPLPSAQAFLAQLKKNVEKVERKDKYLQFSPNRIININLTHEQLRGVIEKKWLEELDACLSQGQDMGISLTTTSRYRNTSGPKVPCFIPNGLSKDFARCIRSITSRPHFPSVYDYLEMNPRSRALNNRIMFVSMLVNQCKNDKMRKNDARGKLWQAQHGAGLMCVQTGAFSNSMERQRAYRYLMDAEKILRGNEKFSENVSCFDYDGDGDNEYVCRMQNYFAYISKISGTIQELELLKNSGNYVDNFSRTEEYDSCTDGYSRGLFVDHLLSAAQFEQYVNGEHAGDGVFSKIHYSELRYAQHHNEVQLCAQVQYIPTKQKILLKKKYFINSTGMNIQYIIKNESSTELNAVFVIESNFTHTSFKPEKITYFDTDVVDNGKILRLPPEKSSAEEFKLGRLLNVNMVSVTDAENGVCFGLEPNESTGFFYMPLLFKRPDFKTKQNEPVALTFVESFFWDLNLAPGKEIEKTINFTFRSVRKEKR